MPECIIVKQFANDVFPLSVQRLAGGLSSSVTETGFDLLRIRGPRSRGHVFVCEVCSQQA
jgi:hypothetical protein